jgi:hypothetical protein
MFNIEKELETIALAANRPCGSTDGTPVDQKEVLAVAHSPRLGWRWYIYEAEIQGDDVLCFGTVVGFEKEMGYFTASQLKQAGAWLLENFIDGECEMF